MSAPEKQPTLLKSRTKTMVARAYPLVYMKISRKPSYAYLF
jgi:hypothetical protein